MKNNADARPYYFYTPFEVVCARDIYQVVQRDPIRALRLYPAAWIVWSAKVIQWHNRFVQVLRRYSRLMRDAALAVTAIWKNLKAGISIVKMIRLMEVREHTPAQWQQNPQQPRGQVPAVIPCNPKTQKHARRQLCQNLTNSLQIRPQL